MSGARRCYECGRGFTLARNRRAPWVFFEAADSMSPDGLTWFCGPCQDTDEGSAAFARARELGIKAYIVLSDGGGLRVRRVEAAKSAPAPVQARDVAL